jgi:excisionase family DNA binding protein
MSTDKKPYVTAAEARQFGIGESAFYRFLREKKIPSIKIGRRYVVPRESFMSWYRSCGGQTEGGSNAA